MWRFQPSPFQAAVLHFLMACALLWLLLLTGHKEYWGFWQSPEIYAILEKSYPQWQRTYVHEIYSPFLAGTLLFFVGWTGHCLGRLREARSGPARIRGTLVLLVLGVLLGVVLGVRGTNNLISWLDRGELHGMSFLPTRE